jgi:hypothetical protein
MMGLDLDPAALGGLAGLIAVVGWIIGRLQSGPLGAARQPTAPAVPTGTADPVAAPAPASARFTTRATIVGEAPASPPCQQRALEERRALLSRPVSLADLHAEVSAFRRDERILERAPQADALLAMARADQVADCRFIGLSGRPTCPATTCHDCHGPGALRVPAAGPAIMASPERC